MKLSDTLTTTHRGGYDRDAPMIPRDATPTSVGGGGGGGASRATASAEGERNSGYRAGDEELPIEVQGRYERMRVLGRGSFGAVTLVKDNHDSKLYAMKTLNVGDRPNERTTALSEARLLRWLKHPCILSLFDTFLSADGRLVCLTTTYCDSGDLAKIVRHAAKTKSPLGEKTVLGWFAQVDPQVTCNKVWCCKDYAHHHRACFPFTNYSQCFPLKFTSNGIVHTDQNPESLFALPFGGAAICVRCAYI